MKLYRHFLVDGQVADRVDTVEGEAVAFTDEANAAARAEVAQAAAVQLAAVQVVTGPEVPPPPVFTIPPAPLPPPTPDQVDAGALATLLETNPDPATWTNDQLRQALIRLIRQELRRRGLL